MVSDKGRAAASDWKVVILQVVRWSHALLSRSLPLLLVWLEALAATPHAASHKAVADRLTALLVAQSLAPAALMRALVSPQLLPARQRYQRVARIWRSAWLCPAWLTAFLVRAALCLAAPDGVPVLALDSVRC